MCLTLRKVRTLEVKPGILDKVHAVCKNVELIGSTDRGDAKHT